MSDPVVIATAAVLGLAWGYGADRLGARWPAHEDGSVRPRDWRTPVAVIAGGFAFAAATWRFGATPVHLVLVGGYVAALVVLLATDLDQRLLPDPITLPLVLFALVAFALGGPFVRSPEELGWAALAAVLLPAGLFVLAIPFGQGAIGQGDLKLLVSVGLFAGAAKLVYGVVVGAVAAGVIVAILVILRRLTLRSFVPYGPFLIAGALWAILALPAP